ncbi:NAD-dependent epimerase/dehydratase family protein [Rhizobium puerariae]|uniref:NAD-dependent epimerase/dehydratase family protein n=1 Tax=Rhizobium puerariae TaxID=1585791 RepID=A0ABV6ACL8_9HYPH
MKRLLITGAAGNMGTALRQRLGHLAEIVRISDIAGMGETAAREEPWPCDLADTDGVMRMVEGCDGIIHLGGVPSENTFARILESNIKGLHNLYEAARSHGKPRILFASTNHTIGFYRQDQFIGVGDPVKPDGLYGVSKCFGEGLARMYFHKFGQETAIVRVGACWPKPTTVRMLSIWLSFDDMASLAERVFKAPYLGCPTIWGVSDNQPKWWDNSASAYLGWAPKDSAEIYRAELERDPGIPARDSSQAQWQGGGFVDDPIYTDQLSVSINR